MVFMKTALLGGFSLFAAVLFGCEALVLFQTSVLPWSKAPATTHITLVLFGMQFSGGWLYLPFAVSVVIAAVAACYSLSLWKNR